MPTAIVTGATGILGREIVAELGKKPDLWTKVHAMSRSNKDQYPANVAHSFVDLQAKAADMAKQLDGVEGEYIFFSAYLQRDSDQENWDVNGDMLDEFLAALEMTGAAATVKRIVLVTGAKQYGVHLGPAKNPMEESDPWLTGDDYPPIFYYRQQDSLKAFVAKHPQASWVVTYPNDVIGFAKGNFMNLATSLGLYAAVSRELSQGSPPEMVFPGSSTFYTKFDTFTSSVLHAEFCLWAALEPRAANQAFNMVNGDVESWQNLFPRLARRFGMRVTPDQFRRPVDASPGGPGSTTDLDFTPPLAATAAEQGLVTAVFPGQLEQRVDLVKWAKRDDVRAAWARLAEREGLQAGAFASATWKFLDFVLGRNFDVVVSMSKARSLGWTGYKDSWTAFSETFDLLEEDKILPKTKPSA